MLIGGVAGIALAGAFLGFGSWLSVGAVALCGLGGAGIGATLAAVASRAKSPSLVAAGPHSELPPG